MRRFLVLFAVALASVGVAWVWEQAQEGRGIPAIRAPARPDANALRDRPLAPDFLLETLDGRELALSELRGKPVVLNFWASWCVPCRLEMPILEDAAKRYRGRVHFLGVNVLDRPPLAKAFVRKLGVTFPSVLDEDGVVLAKYRVVGLPTTVFITRSGRLFEVHAGPFVGPEGARRLEDYIARLLRQP
ncbi:MAG: TlpA disulfide reductase family protein [Armatimonadota bacterium]|nr:TlpA disulfide reductase family protein [Armatimonadota bacterium]MDR7568254.1 TlpA disulfide reductase family protein [Armatimonadota bacterium]MDR7602262.1 TlpA disulfide reductase family protein [Armatimonadota bacterium]